MIVMLLAAANPLLVVLAALFFGGLQVMCRHHAAPRGVDAAVIEAIEGLVIIIVATSFAFRFQRSRWARGVRSASDDEGAPGEGYQGAIEGVIEIFRDPVQLTALLRYV